MADFRRVTDTFWVSPQIELEDVTEAAERGFGTVLNNRPDGESEDQTSSQILATAAQEKGMIYCEIPVTHAGFSHEQIDTLLSLLDKSEKPILAFCRSGTRSTMLWALAQARKGEPVESIVHSAADAGYDLTPIRAMMDMLSSRD